MSDIHQQIFGLLDSINENLEAAHEIITRNGETVQIASGDKQNNMHVNKKAYSVADAMRLRARVYAAMRSRDTIEVLLQRERQLSLF